MKLLVTSENRIILHCTWLELLKISSALNELEEAETKILAKEGNFNQTSVFAFVKIEEINNKIYGHVEAIKQKYGRSQFIINEQGHRTFSNSLKNEITAIPLTLQELGIINTAIQKVLLVVDNFELQSRTNFNKKQFQGFIQEFNKMIQQLNCLV